RAARLAGVVEGVFVHLVGDGVVDDVDVLDALVVGLDPGVDPERLDADDLLLLVGHRAGHVHHVHDDGDGLRLLDLFPAAILLVGPDGHDDGIDRVVRARGNLPLHGALEGALEVTQRFRTALADAGVFVCRRDNVLLAARLEARQGQFLAEDGSHLFHRQLDLKDVPAGLVAGAGAGLALARTERLTGLSWAGADSTGSFLAVAELRHL